MCHIISRVAREWCDKVVGKARGGRGCVLRLIVLAAALHYGYSIYSQEDRRRNDAGVNGSTQSMASMVSTSLLGFVRLEKDWDWARWCVGIFCDRLALWQGICTIEPE